MLKKSFIGLVTLLLVTLLTIQVISLKARAEDGPITGPLTPPITSPEETPTITPTETLTPTPTEIPTPTPVLEDNLVGKVKYNNLGRLSWGRHQYEPAEGVDVKASNFFNNGQRFTTTTDEDGMYSLDLPSGLFIVKVRDDMHTFFVPPLDVVRIRDHMGHPARADFEGLRFTGFPFNR